MKIKFVVFAYLCLFLSACTDLHSQLLPQKENIIFIGNSITLHPPALNIGWNGNFGMAASSEDTDYVHIISRRLNANFKAFNLADWERNYSNYDFSELKKNEGWADLVIIKLGENVTEITPEFTKSFENLLKQLNCNNSVVVSTWWDKPQLNKYMRSVTLTNNYKWVQLPEHDATYNATNFKHSGVSTHPGDKGMQLIADSILSEIIK